VAVVPGTEGCRVRATGEVFSGRGEGSFYVSIYSKNFEVAIGFRPYPGTLNIKLKNNIKLFNKCLYKIGGVEVQPPRLEGARFGAVVVYPARIIRGFDVWDVYIVRPRITHYKSDVVEVISKEYLRSEMGVNDGDIVEVEIKCCNN
jgi:riboflavin kinase